MKIRGQRVELEEIERVLNDVEEVSAAAVRLDDRGSTQRLVAYVEPEIDTRKALDACVENLPSVMVPQIVALPKLPRGSTGKIDQQALADVEPPRIESSMNGPMDEVERILADIWADVLGLDSVGVTDDFFALGGDSLLGIRVIARAHEAGLTVSAADFYLDPTIRSMGRAAVKS